jgi:GDPmannose 4,6-dehydratase
LKTALITGITGQDGSYLAEHLLETGRRVHGIVRRTSTNNTARIAHLIAAGRIALHTGDMSDGSSLMRIIEKVRPDEVYNLAAQSHVGASFETPDQTADVVAAGPLRVLEAIRRTGLPARFYQASSSELFGKAAEFPQRETTPFHPRSPYGVAKTYAYWITVNYREAYGLFTCNGILFNHESPRRGVEFVTRKITTAVAAVRAGRQEHVTLGNLDAQRDWGFAGDYVGAMRMMLEHPTPEDFVIATGQTHTVRKFAELAFGCIGMEIAWRGSNFQEEGVERTTGKVRVRIDPQFYRPAEVDRLCGDYDKARRALGWQPKVSFEQLVQMMVEADIRASGG